MNYALRVIGKRRRQSKNRLFALYGVSQNGFQSVCWAHSGICKIPLSSEFAHGIFEDTDMFEKLRLMIALFFLSPVIVFGQLRPDDARPSDARLVPVFDKMVSNRDLLLIPAQVKSLTKSIADIDEIWTLPALSKSLWQLRDVIWTG